LIGDLTSPLHHAVHDKGKFDLILANLPYVRDHLYGVLDQQITWEPRAAILGGADGMEFYNRLFAQLPDYLNPDGLVLYEIDGRIYEKVIS
jgi:release factor glutamine methyltransferase